MGVFRKLRDQRQASSDRGAVLVEFVLTIPIIIILVIGIIEMGWLTLHFSEVWSGAREGARHAATVGDSNGDGIPNFADCDDIAAFALGRMAVSGATPGDVTITYVTPGGTTYACDGGTPPPADLEVGSRITVTVAATYDALGIPFIGNFFDGLALDSSSTRSIQSGWEF